MCTVACARSAKTFIQRLDQRCTGMEFATEMIIKSTLFGARISEIPITLYKDGRTAHRPHLRTFRDGWRTLAILFCCRVRVGRSWCLAWYWASSGALRSDARAATERINLAGVVFDAHTLLVATLGNSRSRSVGLVRCTCQNFCQWRRLVATRQSLRKTIACVHP